MDAVAPDLRTSFSPDRLRSTYAHIAYSHQIPYILEGNVATHVEKRRRGPRLQIKYHLAVRILQPREHRSRPQPFVEVPSNFLNPLI